MQTANTTPSPAMQRLIARHLDKFKQDIKPLKGTKFTPENALKAMAIIHGYAVTLQMMDLSLSLDEAKEVLKYAYLTIEPNTDEPEPVSVTVTIIKI